MARTATQDVGDNTLHFAHENLADSGLLIKPYMVVNIRLIILYMV